MTREELSPEYQVEYDQFCDWMGKIPSIISRVDILPNDALKAIFKLSESKILMVSKYMGESDIPRDFIVYSVFENKKLIESDMMPVDILLRHFSPCNIDDYIPSLNHD